MNVNSDSDSVLKYFADHMLVCSELKGLMSNLIIA